jgi:hypothetical protein
LPARLTACANRPRIRRAFPRRGLGGTGRCP